MSTATVWLDIETIPTAWTLTEGYAATLERVPSNYSKPDSIARWVAEHMAETWKRTALDPLLAQVVCISAAVEDEEPTTWYGDAPGPLVDGLAAFLRDVSDHRIAGWHVLWDVDVLRWQAARCGCGDLGRLLPTRRYDVLDVHEADILSRGRIGLVKAAAACGLAGKVDGIHGGDVWRLWGAGERAKVAEYCAGDVRLARDVAIATGVWAPNRERS